MRQRESEAERERGEREKERERGREFTIVRVCVFTRECCSLESKKEPVWSLVSDSSASTLFIINYYYYYHHHVDGCLIIISHLANTDY